jgi:hypothetical protein
MKTLLSKEQAVGLHRSVEKMNQLASRRFATSAVLPSLRAPP